MKAAFLPGHAPNQHNEKIWLISHAAFWSPSPSCKQDLASGLTMMTELSHLLEKCTSMIQLQSQLSNVFTFLKEPVCCTALLIWLASCLFNDDFYEWTALSMSIPCAFHILDEVFEPSHNRLPSFTHFSDLESWIFG